MRPPAEPRPIVTCGVCGFLGYVAEQRWTIQHRLQVICETCRDAGAHFGTQEKSVEPKPVLVRRSKSA